MTKFVVTNVGRYSITHPKDANRMSEIIKSYFPKSKKITITDATANNGGNTVSFAKHFKKVNAVEIDKKEYDALKKNTKDFKNVTLYNEDYLNLIQKLKQDAVFIDPPWGGRGYKKKNKIRLYLSKHSLVDVIDMLNEKTKIIMCKVPFNYDFQNLLQTGMFKKKITIETFPKYLVFIVH